MTEVINNDVLESKKTMKAREKRRRSRANKKQRRKLGEIQVNDVMEAKRRSKAKEKSKRSYVNKRKRALMTEVVEQLSAPVECSAASSRKYLEGHAQVDNNSETTRKGVREVPLQKKRELTSDSSLPSTEDIHGNSAEGFASQISNKVPVSTHTIKLKEEIKTEVLENSVEENGNLYDASLKDISDKCPEEFNKSRLNAESGTSNMELMSQDGITIVCNESLLPPITDIPRGIERPEKSETTEKDDEAKSTKEDNKFALTYARRKKLSRPIVEKREGVTTPIEGEEALT